MPHFFRLVGRQLHGAAAKRLVERMTRVECRMICNDLMVVGQASKNNNLIPHARNVEHPAPMTSHPPLPYRKTRMILMPKILDSLLPI